MNQATNKVEDVRHYIQAHPQTYADYEYLEASIHGALKTFTLDVVITKAINEGYLLGIHHSSQTPTAWADTLDCELYERIIRALVRES